MMKKALTIAGSDSGGGAGIQADLKTFAAHGVFGMSVITAVTAQNTVAVVAVQDIAPDIIAKQIEAVLSDIGADGIKIGMVSQAESIKAISRALKPYGIKNIVIDPVMVAKSGYPLLRPEAVEVLRHDLLPLATLLTPNLAEAELLSGVAIQSLADMKEAARAIYQMGPRYVLVKGGHLPGNANDLLFDGREFLVLEGKRIDTPNTHGTGCTLSSAITANLVNGLDMVTAVKQAKQYVTGAIAHSFPLGKGHGPTHHFYELYEKAGLNVNEK